MTYLETIKGYDLSVDSDPDYEGFYSIWADKNGSGFEVCGKIAHEDVAQALLCALRDLSK